MSRTSSILITAQLLAALLLSLLLQIWVLPQSVQAIATTFPEVQSLVVPGIIWGVAAIVCLQAIVVVGLRMVRRVRGAGASTSTIKKTIYRSLWIVVCCLLAFLALVIAAYATLAVLGYSTPLMLWLLAAGILTAAAASALALFLGSRPGVGRDGRSDRPRVDAAQRPA
jgi:hypothetical protein